MATFESVGRVRERRGHSDGSRALPGEAAPERAGHPLLAPATSFELPRDREELVLEWDSKRVKLTNLSKLFWPDLGVSKRDLLQFYADLAPVLIPHLAGRAMVMKRYPHGAGGPFFFMKRAPAHRPDWLSLCRIEHASGSVIGFPVVNDLPSLLWIVNLGCIDLNPWYARCDDVDRPDFLHFDLDPVPGAGFDSVLQTALILRRVLDALGASSYPKTTGSRGIHVYVPIVRGPLQKQVWSFAKALANGLAAQHPKLITAEYIIARRPHGRVLVDYNQNAWGRTLASVYSVRPSSFVSTPVTWDEVQRGVAIGDFRLDNVRERVAQCGDLWAPLLTPEYRYDMRRVL